MDLATAIVAIRSGLLPLHVSLHALTGWWSFAAGSDDSCVVVVEA